MVIKMSNPLRHPRTRSSAKGRVREPPFGPQPAIRCRDLPEIAEPYSKCLSRPSESAGCGTSLDHSHPLLRNLQHRTVDKQHFEKIKTY
jgi:hypothetical protein